ncbi:hypothetical protein T484DRAFT_1861907 [Baffinella frigidus]|nr:hypothetical protein T484DRAFT_1861907 [Cryptophyta sp. CCMP2293]
MANKVVLSLEMNIELGKTDEAGGPDAVFRIILENMAPEPSSVLNTTSRGAVVTLEPAGDQPGDFLFCVDRYGARTALWDPITFTLSLRVCSANQPFRANTLYSVAFLAANPSAEQPCPDITADAISPYVNVDKRSATKSDISLLGVEHASCPLTVFRARITSSISQDQPFISQDNVLVLEVMLNFDFLSFQGSRLTLSGLSGASVDAASNGESASAVDPTGTWCLPAQWFDAASESVTIAVCNQKEAIAGDTYSISFPIRNPPDPQDAPKIMLSVSSSQKSWVDGAILPELSIVNTPVTTHHRTIFGVPLAADPLFVLAAFFRSANISQTNPFASAKNEITVVFSHNVEVPFSFSPNITISGLGAGAFDVLNSVCDVGGLVGFSSYGEGELVVTLCPGRTLPAVTTREFSFTLVNPAVEQDPTDVMISMTSTRFVMIEKVMARPGIKQDGVLRFTDPPLVIIAAIVTQHIEQSTALSGVANRITISLKATVDVLGTIVLCCFGDPVRYIANASLDLHHAGGLGCDAAAFDEVQGKVEMFNCTLSSQVLTVFTFWMTNPVENQEAAVVSASTTLKTKPFEMDINTESAFEVAGFHQIGRTIVPEFLTQNVQQSSPVAGMPNRITVELELSVLLSGSDSSAITISNLVGAQSAPTLSLDAVKNGNGAESLFCGQSGERSVGIWNNESSTVVLVLCADKTMYAGVLYSMAFTITNPSGDQDSPLLTTKAWGVAVHIAETAMNRNTSALLDFQGGASPLQVVVPRFIQNKIAQSTPLADTLNYFTVTLATNLRLPKSFSLTLEGWAGATFVNISASWMGGREASLLCEVQATTSGLIASLCEDIPLGVNVVFSVAVMNPGASQAPSTMSVRITGSDFSIPAIVLTPPHSMLIGVANGADPMLIIVPRFVHAALGQSSPLTVRKNTLSLTLATNVNLEAADDSRITVTGATLNGMSSDASRILVSVTIQEDAQSVALGFQLFCVVADSELTKSTAEWDTDSGVIVFKLCVGRMMVAGPRYVLQWTITNPAGEQSSPEILVRASGTGSFAATEVAKPGTEILGVVNGANSLLVVKPNFGERSIAQSTLMGLETNTITMTLSCNIDLASSVGGTETSFFSISGLAGATVSDADAFPIISAGVGGASDPEFCRDALGTNGSGHGVWGSSDFSLRLYLCPGSTIRAGEAVQVSFDVTNPNVRQESPDVTVSVGGTRTTIAGVAMDKPVYQGALVYGLGNVSDVMKVRVPEFMTKAIGQSSPFSGQENVLTVTLQTIFELSGSFSHVVTISNLQGMTVSGDTVPLENVLGGYEGQYLFCSDDGANSTGSWVDDTKALVLRVCPDTTMEAGRLYKFKFRFTNPKVGSRSPDVRIEAAGIVNPIPQLSMTKDYTSVASGVWGGAEVLWVLFQDFTTTTVGQTNPIATRANTILVTLVASMEFQPPLSFTLSGFLESAVHAVKDVGTDFVNISMTSISNTTSFCALAGDTRTRGKAVVNGSTLQFTLCTGSSIPWFTDIVIGLNVTNPDAVLPARTLEIVVAGYQYDLKRDMTAPEGGSWDDSTSSLNTISMTLQSNVDVTKTSDVNSGALGYVGVCCLGNAIYSDAGSIIAVSVTHTAADSEVALPHFCRFNDGTGGAGSGYWDENTGELKLYLCPSPADNKISSGLEFVVSFVVQNPSFNAESPQVLISGVCASVTLESAAMVKLHSTEWGVVNGNDPLKVVVPEFTTQIISQTTPVASVANTITVTLTASVQLSGADASVITLSNLFGAVADPPVSLGSSPGGNEAEYLFCGDSGASKTGVWDSEASTLTLRLCANKIMIVGVEYIMHFTMTNPASDQESPSVSIEATGERVTMPAASMAKDGRTLLGVSGGFEVLKVVVPFFTTKRIAQATPVADIPNTITITLSSSFSLSAALGSSMTVTNMVGLPVSDRAVTISDVGAGPAISPLVCSSAGQPGIGDWDESTSNLEFLVCDGQTVQLNTEYVFTISFVNPGDAQSSPTVQVVARNSMFEIFLAPMTKLGQLVLGVVDGSDPLRVALRSFGTRHISQSTPLAGFDNTLTIVLEAFISLEAGTVITISGLVGAESSAETFLKSVVKDGADTGMLFCADSVGAGASSRGVWEESVGVWKESLGSLELTVCPGRILDANYEYTIVWMVENPAVAQSAPAISIEASGAVVFDKEPMIQPMTDSLGVIAGNNALLVLVPLFEIHAIGQNNFLADEVNTISVTLQSNINAARLDMSESATKLPLYTARLANELDRVDKVDAEMGRAYAHNPVLAWERYLHPKMLKVGEEIFGWRSLGGTGKAPFRDKKQVILDKELRVIEQLKGRLLHCSLLECEGMERLDLCNTSLEFFASDAPSLPPGVLLHPPRDETREDFLARLREGERQR